MFQHQPVMLREVVEFLAPAPGRVFVDGTLGGGGHSEALLRAGAGVFGVDRDQDALDAAGVRLICPFIQDIYQTAALIRDIPGVQVVAEKDYIHAPKPNGYRSYHMVLTMPLRFLKEQPEPEIQLEVQLRTIAMDCWASIEHQLKYKRDIPNQRLIVQELKRCADEITSTDLSLQTIRELLEAPGQEELSCGS